MQSKQKCGIGLLVCGIGLLLNSAPTRGQIRSTPVRVAYSALSAGIGVLWLTHEQGIFRKHALDSNLVYMRNGTTATQALIVLWTQRRSSNNCSIVPVFQTLLGAESEERNERDGGFTR